MSVTFVIGRSGSGKTRYCFEAIRDALAADPLGPPLYWILPRQATFDAERILTCESGLGGFCRARVLSFEKLGREIFADCGGIAIPEVSGLGRQMILGHLLRQLKPQLRFYKGVARQVGLSAQLDGVFAELERNGKSADDVRATIADLAIEQGSHITPLRDKLHDLHLIYSSYTSFLGQGRLDQHQRDKQVYNLLGKCSLLRGASFFIDGFLDFTSHERNMLAGVAGVASRVVITLAMDPGSSVLANPNMLPLESSSFFRAEQTYRKLYFAFHETHLEISEPVTLRAHPRFKAPALEHIEKCFFSASPQPFTDPASSDVVERLEASDVRAEVDAVARRIRAITSDGSGVRLRDIIVLARHLDRYHAIIDASFAEHDIPWFADRRRSGSHHPLLRVVRSFFQITRSNWRQDAVMTLIRSGLVGITDYEADAVANYLDSHQIRGVSLWESTEPWEFQQRSTSEEDGTIPASQRKLNANDAPIDIDAVRRKIVERLQPMSEIAASKLNRTVRQIAVAIYQTLDRLGAPAELSRWTVSARQAKELEEAAEHEQVWAGLSDLFQQMVELLGEETLELAEFVDVLEAGLDQFDLALTPPMVDQVLVGQVDRTRSPRVRVAFVLGLNEGSFPATLGESSILTDRERRALKAKSLELDPDLRTRAMDERLLGYIALTRASERLILTRATADAGGKKIEPSIFWRRISTLIPESFFFSVAGGSRTDIEGVATPRQLTTALMRWVRDGAASEGPSDPVTGTSPWPALFQWFAAIPSDESPIDLMRRKAWRALEYQNDAKLDSRLCAQLFPRDTVATARQIETFGACPFKHFARYGLGLKPPARGELRPSDLSQLYHRVLNRVMRQSLRNQDDTAPESISQAMIRACTTEVSETLRRALRLGASRTAYLLQRTERILTRFIEAQHTFTAQGQFRPALTGVRFGADQSLRPVGIRTPGGAHISLQGSIDRVDLLAAGKHAPDPVPAVVIDYRQSSGALRLDEVFHGLTLELVIALLALEASTASESRPMTPVGAFVYPMLKRFTETSRPEDGANIVDEDLLLADKPRGVFSLDQLGNFDREMMSVGGKSKVVNASIKVDGTLGSKRTSDALEPEEFVVLLSHVTGKIGETVDLMLSGAIAVTPYLLGNRSPCPHCDFRDVCRFQTTTNRYRVLPTMGREQVIQHIISAEAEAADGG